MMKPLISLVSLFAILSTLLSCATHQDEMIMLEKTTMAYERAFRWGDFARAKSFHKDESVLEDLERRRLKFYRVTGYSILQNNTPDPFNAHLLVEVKYYKHDSAVIKTINVRQHWKRDKGSKTWYLNSAFPKLR